MNTKFIVLMTLLIMAACDTTVNKTDVCTGCTQFKSQVDCTNYGGCTWTAGSGTTAGSCAKTPTTPYIPYCQGVANPGTTCASTYGCAYLEGKCTNFAGCSAYVKTTTSDCQAISYSCISDGTVCTDALECSKYSATQCTSTPDLNGRKCTLDSTSNTCRNYNCSEADATYTSDKACYTFSSGCVTTGAGCVTLPLPACSSLTGTETSCLLMTGMDGPCKLNTGTTNCTVKLCTDAPNLTTDADCKKFLPGCVTTGKGCIATFGSCSSYQVTNAPTDCAGYIGNDGVCEGDSGATTCRARVCDKGTGTTDEQCATYKPGCVTNGKQCLAARLSCSGYTGTITTCVGLIGIDGNCKGTATTVGPCVVKACDTESASNPSAYTTDTQCQAIQKTCKTTGLGCVAALTASCTSYTSTATDGSDCLTRVGSEGKCKAGTGGKCAAKACTDAPAITTSNSACNTFKTGCVTNGAGCISQTQCINTVAQTACQGTTENSAFCNWNPICVDNTTCSFATPALCASQKAVSGSGVNIVYTPCIWDTNSCRQAKCTDFTGASYQSDSACAAALTGCVTNGTGCVSPICSNFKGTQATCLAYKAYCTNSSTAAATVTCVDKSCTDSLTYTSDSDCITYLSSCLTNGNGCISNKALCASYSGTPDQCDKFYGYDDGTVSGTRCWNTSGTSGSCVKKQCSQATTATQDSDCSAFLTGCVWDGGSSCINPTDCSLFKGTSETVCQNFKSGGKACWWTGGSNCTKRLCSHNNTVTSDSECGTFLTGCLTDGSGCIDPSSACSAYLGTASQCSAFTGNSIKCTRLEACTKKTCSDKTNASTNADCIAYHSTCRIKQGTQTCYDEQSSCASYTSFASGATDADKLAYCNVLKLKGSATLCGYDSSVTDKCSDRTCALWSSTLTNESCANYVSTNGCRLAANGVCYKPAACTYTIPSTVSATADKLTWCNNMSDNSATPLACTFDTAQKCKAIDSCELVVSPTSITNCLAFFSVGSCQFSGGKCISTQTGCTSYSLTGISTQSAYCSALKQVNTGNITYCKYDSGTPANCIAKTCADVSNPTSQYSCDLVVDGCIYYSGVCYTPPAACSSYTVSGTDAVADRLKCQNLKNSGGKYCSYSGTGAACADGIADCAGQDGASLAVCGLLRADTGKACFYSTASKCEAPDADECKAVTGISTTASCDLYTTPGLCNNISGTCTVKGADCTTYNYSTATSADTKSADCQKFIDKSSKYCSWASGADTKCASAPATCAGWNGLTATTDNTAFCQARIDIGGNKCTYTLGRVTCRQYQAWEVTTIQSQADCNIYETGYKYYKGSCYKSDANCNTYIAYGTDESAKLGYCNGLQNSGNGACTYIKGTYNCINKGACASYSLTDVAADTLSTACSSIVSTDSAGCTYWPITTANCVKIDACTSYKGTVTADQCAAQKDATGLVCINNPNNTDCNAPATCEDIASPATQKDCDKYLTGCTYYSSKCYTSKDCTLYTVPGSGTAFCLAVKDKTSGVQCTGKLDGTSSCVAKQCSDVVYSTHALCQAYLSTCKSDGAKCIDASKTCAYQSGIPTFCTWSLDIDGVSTCTNATAASDQQACTDKTCTQNVTATTDGECDTYLTGCLTTGQGCISKTANCSAYYGTQSTCQNFTGHDGPCWGTASAGPCKVRACSDNTTATSDSDCKLFLSSCLTNGAGCISNSSPCSAYKGTQTTCKSFTGSDGKCWNSTTATATASCQARTCSLYTGTTDSDCDNFIPAAANALLKNCVTNGTTCVAGTTNCSGFKGTYLTCPNFSAADGPCKATSYSATAAACTPKVCTEAPNNLATDTECKKYHPYCVTTGKGCVAASDCKYIQSSAACSARSGCVWANQCRAAALTCASLTNYGQSICTNTLLNDGTTKCAWSGNLCRNFQCTDFDATLTTHAACSALNTLTMSCTTSGAGCVPYSTCSTYTTPSICAAANTTETAIRCNWDSVTAKCRTRLCTDNQTATTDTDCNTYLAGCKTSGLGCVGPNFSCNVFTTPQLCQVDGYGLPCLWVGKLCYNYADCTDATFASLTGCQAYNPLCVPSATTCIAQTSCASYTSIQSCTVGISSSVCGWLPTGKCSVFGACTDAIGTSNTDCANYSSTCITDGTKCVAIGTCSSYLTQTACGNAGSDGQCNWVASSSSCRLAVCTDKTATTDLDCLGFIVSSGKCTTDGTTCVARAACTSYTTEAACTIGSDGISCIFNYPVGTTSGTKSCRAKECSDVTGTTNDQCNGQIVGKTCVSNGKICVKQDTCANYKNKISCSGGGSDGVCAFAAAPTTADPLAGTCVQFSSCDKANNDQTACTSKSAVCQWTSTVSGTTTTTSCAVKTCVQAASGSTCNYIPSFDGTKYTICNSVNNVCTASDPSTLAQATCYSKSAYTYTWNESTSKCVSCNGSTTTPTNNSTGGNTTNQTNTTTDTNGYILGITIPLAILGLFA